MPEFSQFAVRPLDKRVILLAIIVCLVIGRPLAAVRAETKPSATVSPETRRVRELIYLFRQYRVFSRDEEWARTVRELVEIGKPAVPELVAELDRTDRNSTLRSLGFALRAIGDSRAVPALIRAIPKTLGNQGSDCGVVILDAELHAFMRKHQNHPQPDEDQSILRGRPVNEILTALEKLTDHPVPHPGGEKNDDRRERWLAWWEEHKNEYPEDEGLKAVEQRPKQVDLVEQAGLARFGPIFPTGPEWRLGLVQEVTLELNQYANGKSYLDFDKGRVCQILEGLRLAEFNIPKNFGVYHKWEIDNGIDLTNNGGFESRDMNAWLIDNDRWETLEEEIRSGDPLILGPETTSILVPFEKHLTDWKFDRIGTFLFTTREGGRGIVQTFPPTDGGYTRTLRYRMLESTDAPPAKPLRENAAPKAKTPFGKIVTVTLPSMAKNVKCLFDLETERNAALPPEFENTLANSHTPFHDTKSAKWCRERGIDIVGLAAPVAKENAAAAEKRADRIREDGFQGIQLHGLGMTAVRILPKSFYRLGVEEVQDLLDRQIHQQPDVAYMSVQYNTPGLTESYAIRTADGSIGLIKLELDADDPDNIRLRYRLYSTSKESE